MHSVRAKFKERKEILPSVALSREDLEHILVLFRNTCDQVMVSDKTHEYDSLDEVVKRVGAYPKELSFIGTRPSVTVNLLYGSSKILYAEVGDKRDTELAFIMCDFVRTGTSPVISFLLDEISGAFMPFSSSVSDPPQLYGATGGPATLFSNRYYFNQTTQPAWCRHMQIRVNFGATDTAQNELLTLTIFGSHHQEA